jgi:biopolymer transport protein ExbB
MAEIKPTATASVKATSVQPKKSSNAISWIAPIICLIAGYGIWRFIFGNPDGSDVKGTGWFWPKHDKPKGALNGIYMGGIIVPILVGMFLMVVVFSIERYLTIRRALGNGSISDFIRKIQYHLANRNVDAALSECDKQRGSVGNVMKAGLRRYKEMINEGGLNTEQKVISIQKK